MVRIVTDSTADIPRELAQQYGILVIPAIVNFGLESYHEGADLSTSEFFARLVISETLPTTSQPSIGEFTEAYASFGDDDVLAIHLASGFSGLLGTARLAASLSPHLPVTVYDSGQLSMGIGLMVLEAARAARNGAALSDIVSMLDRLKPRTHLFAVLDTLEYARRGGRLSRIGAMVGKILSIRPTIQAHNNKLAEVARTRHRRASLHRLVQFAETHAPFERLVVLHAAAPETAAEIADRLAQLNSGERPAIIEAGSVVGTHAGPGAVGFACITAE